MTSSIRPIYNFGLFTGIAVLLTFVLSFTLLPAMLAFVRALRAYPAAHRNAFHPTVAN